MKKKILVIGSANIDMVVKSERFPEAGETILGGNFQMYKGGKGANQAVSAAKLGGDVSFICKLGNDEFGTICIDQYKKVNINVDNILIDKEISTGVAMISVNFDGENKIVVAPGANHSITKKEILNLKETITNFDFIVLQLEIPIEIVGLILKIAKRNKIQVILNPAPALKLPSTFFEGLFLITPNQNEAEKLCGIPVDGNDSLVRAAGKLQNSGVKNVVITLGERGVYAKTNQFSGILPAPKVKVQDTTAAGDVFNGALTVALANSIPWKEAITFANRAAALAVAKNGAQNSSPTLSELEEF